MNMPRFKVSITQGFILLDLKREIRLNAAVRLL